MRFEIGRLYKVNCDGLESGNIIRIIGNAYDRGLN